MSKVKAFESINIGTSFFYFSINKKKLQKKSVPVMGRLDVKKDFF